jgi:hypothetical protein
MNFEQLKAFGAWMSDMLYWLLESVFGSADDETQVDGQGARSGGYYSSRAEALASGAIHQMGNDDGGPGYYL